MKGIFGFQFSTKVLDEICPVHPDTRLEYAKQTGKFCRKCVSAQMVEEKQEFDRKISNDEIHKYFHASLVANIGDFNKTFDNFDAKKGSLEQKLGNEAYKIALTYIKTPKLTKKEIRKGKEEKMISAIFIGKPGEGKTHLAMSIANKVANAGQKVLFVDANELWDRIKKSWSDPTELWTEANAKKSMSHADLVIIDDLGSESSMKDGDKASKSMQNVLKGTLDKQKRIIITTNLTINELNEVYNPKIVSRMLEGTINRRLDFSGIPDKRLLH